MDSRTLSRISDINHAIANAELRNWNHIVGPRARYLREEKDHVVFLHPTKGYRHIAKRRLGLAN